MCVCVREREREREGESGRREEELGGVCCMGNEKKSLLSLTEQALFMISKAEELKCLRSTLSLSLFFF